MVKLLSIFSGLTFARGHMTMHFALFFGSFSVIHENVSNGVTFPVVNSYNDVQAFVIMRWTHLAVLLISLFAYWCNIPSKLDIQEG